MTDEELQRASKQVLGLMFEKCEEMQVKFNLGRTEAMLSVLADQVSMLIVLNQERSAKGAAMPTKQETSTVAKLMLVIVNVFGAGDDKVGDPKEFTLEELKPMADEAVAEAQKMLASWGKRD